MGAASGLRQQILADFGVDLPLEGGSGLLEDPYLLACESAVEAANAQLELLHILGKRRRQPWRLQGIEIAGGEDGSLIRAGIERLERHEKEVIAEQASCYFRFQQIRDPVSVLTVADAGGHVDPRSGVRLPFQLGWLHLDDATDNEADTPGLGWTVTYESAGMKGTVFVYDHCEPLTSDERRVGASPRRVRTCSGRRDWREPRMRAQASGDVPRALGPRPVSARYPGLRWRFDVRRVADDEQGLLRQDAYYVRCDGAGVRPDGTRIDGSIRGCDAAGGPGGVVRDRRAAGCRSGSVRSAGRLSSVTCRVRGERAVGNRVQTGRCLSIGTTVH